MTLTSQICQILTDGQPRTCPQLAELLGVEVIQIREAMARIQSSKKVHVDVPERVYRLTPIALARIQGTGEVLIRRRERDAAAKRRQRAEKGERAAVKQANDRIRTEEQREKAERNRRRYLAKTQIRDAVAGKIPNSVFALARGAHA